jgi:PKD repeat protein
MWFLRNDAVFANFAVNKTTGNKNDSTVVFTDKSYGNPEGWTWNFGANASPQTLTGKGPHTVKYTDIGYKDVTLTINVGQEEYICVKKNALYVTWPAGINTPDNGKQYTLFPNPASTWVKLSGFERGIIKVYNSSGVMVWESRGTTENNSIDVSGLAPGMYIIRILDTNGKMISKKLTIAK